MVTYTKFHLHRSRRMDSKTEYIYKKVKVPRNSPEGPEKGRGIDLLLLDLGTRMGGWSALSPSRFTPGKDPVSIVREAGWATRPVWKCAKNLAPTGIRSPDRPARNQSLYRLSYPDPEYTWVKYYNHSRLFSRNLHLLNNFL
jgi:hypothetical protein